MRSEIIYTCEAPRTCTDGASFRIDFRGVPGILLIRFRAHTVRTNGSSGVGIVRMTIHAGQTLVTKMLWRLCGQDTEIRAPFEGTDAIVSAEFIIDYPDGIVCFSPVKVETVSGETWESITPQTGMFCAEPFEDVRLEDTFDRERVGPTIDIEIATGYLYAIGRSSLSVVSLADPAAPKTVGRVEGLGYTRQLSMSCDGSYAFVTGRHHGVMIIDVRDPYAPCLINRYDSIELATGICTYGKYMLVANRQYGVEVVDMSDVMHPVNLGLIRCGEAQSCHVADGLLYVGLWGEHRVDIYDIRVIGAPVCLAKIRLDGKGDGFAVHRDAAGRVLLYASTGHHTGEAGEPSVKIVDSYRDLRFGQGNGMDIFDVTDPAHPVHLSTVKSDARFYYLGEDYWETVVADAPDGKTYAYNVNTFLGCYVYDVTDPADPKRIARVSLPVPKNSPHYEYFDPNRGGRCSSMPWDTEKEVLSPVGAVAALNGYLYLAGLISDVGVWANPSVHAPEKSVSGMLDADSVPYYALPQDHFGFSDIRLYRSEGQVYSCVRYGDFVFTACGLDGIAVLSRDLTLIRRYPTRCAVQHLTVVGDRLYSSESQDGLAVYRITEDKLMPLRRIRSGHVYPGEDRSPLPENPECVRMSMIAPDERWALVQSIGNAAVAVSLEDGHSAGKYDTVGLMYFRNLTNGLVGDRYVACYGNGGEQYWIDLASSPPVKMGKYPRATSGMRSGDVAVGEYCLSSAENGYYLYRPEDVFGKETLTELPFVGIADVPPGLSVQGKAAVSGNMLMLSERIRGDVFFVDISDLYTPRFLRAIHIAGAPDLMTADSDYIYLPAGYQGLLRLPRGEI